MSSKLNYCLVVVVVYGIYQLIMVHRYLLLSSLVSMVLYVSCHDHGQSNFAGPAAAKCAIESTDSSVLPLLDSAED